METIFLWEALVGDLHQTRALTLDLLGRCRLIAMPGGAADTSETVAEVNSDITMQALTA